MQISFSPDGQRLAYLENRLSEGKTALVVANADGTGEREIITRQAPNYYWTALKPSWSPNGKLIACIGQNATESFPHIFVINVETGAERPITAQKWNSSLGVIWLPDMSGLLFAAAEEVSSNVQIWYVSYPDGEARRITNDTVNYRGLSLAADGRAIVTTQIEAPASVWVMPIETERSDNGLPVVITDRSKDINAVNFTQSGNWSAYARLAWTPNGRIVYVSEESGNADIWTMNPDGTDRRQLTTDPHWDTSPSVSPDGRYIVFMSNRVGTESCWLMDIDGANQKQLTNKLIERQPVFSADSKGIYFESWETGKGAIWKVSLGDGQLTQVVKDLSFRPAISPDGQLLACVSDKKILVVPAQGGEPIRTFDRTGSSTDWTPDGRGLRFIGTHAQYDRINVDEI